MSPPVYWCHSCNVPLISNKCDLCKIEGKLCSNDLKPVFLPERELFLSQLSEKSVSSYQLPFNLFRYRNRIIANGEFLFTFKVNANGLKLNLKKQLEQISFIKDEKLIEKMIDANKRMLRRKELQTIRFIKKTAKLHRDKKILVSFSGGKDSAVTSYLVYKALGQVKLVFSNTSIEFPETVKFVKDFARTMNFKLIELKPPRNFFDLCEKLGPPSRMMRWCCFTQKSGPINEYYATLSKYVLSFDGIRRMESRSREKFERIRKNTKIIKQYSAYPIFEWTDFELWLYILWRKIPINPLYFYGFNRIGCWVCPNNGKFDDFLLRQIHPELYEKWKKWLVNYARKNRKTLSWVHKGEWKQRKTKYKKFEVCTIQSTCPVNNKFIIALNGHKVTEELLEFFKVFGKREKKLLCNETLVQFANSDVILSAIIGGNILKVKVNNVKKLKRKLFEIIKQLEKALNCVGCGACMGSCPFGAIKVKHGKFKIDETRCIQCLTCVTSKYLKQSCVALHYKSNRNIVHQGLEVKD